MANNKLSGDAGKNKSGIDYRPFPLSKINFIMMGVCCVLIVLGFILIGGEPSTETFNPDIFSTRRIIVGPFICFLGFLLMPVAIMWKGKRSGDKKE